MTILIQGAMDEEIDVLCKNFVILETKQIAGFDFFVCDHSGNKVIISKTKIGLINSSVATTIAIKEFSPDLVINQGCAGGHSYDAKIGDVIVADKSVYINNFQSPKRKKGEGSNSLEWLPHPKRSYEIFSTEKYIPIALSTKTNLNLRLGTLGSGDIFSKETDRIEYLSSLFGELCEDMESIASMKTCEDFMVDKISFRIISNNELLSDEFDITTCQKLQEFVIEFVKNVINLNA